MLKIVLIALSFYIGAMYNDHGQEEQRERRRGVNRRQYHSYNHPLEREYSRREYVECDYRQFLLTHLDITHSVNTQPELRPDMAARMKKERI
jgi:hypothetical protein